MLHLGKRANTSYSDPFRPPYLLSQSSGCELWTHNRPSRSRPPPPAWKGCRICSCPGPRWLCPQPGPRSAVTPRSGDRPRPSPLWPAASPRATDSSRRWPESSACLYISVWGRKVGALSDLVCLLAQKNVGKLAFSTKTLQFCLFFSTLFNCLISGIRAKKLLNELLIISESVRPRPHLSIPTWRARMRRKPPCQKLTFHSAHLG